MQIEKKIIDCQPDTNARTGQQQVALLYSIYLQGQVISSFMDFTQMYFN